MDRQSVEKYLEGVRELSHSSDFIPRFFSSRKDWDRLSPLDVHRTLEAFRDLQPSLADILANPSAVILGEPGMGKSTLSRAAVISVLDLSTDELSLPIRLELRSYRGSLTQLLEAHGLPAELLGTRQLRGKTVVTTLILDGLDEVGEGYVEKLVAEIEQRLAMNGSFRALITCRQAFYATVRDLFRNPPAEFYLLGFASSDIKTYLQRHKIETKAFLNEIGRLGLELETSNPFTLLTLTKYWRRFGRLASRRSEILAYVIEELIALRPRFAPRQQRRALQMLAMAMETACKNELSFEEANTVLIKAMPVSPTEAESILSELLHTILIRVSGNFVFQMRSYGEFLAAEEMATYSIERVLEFIYYRGTRIPNHSWTNAISYLVETNPAARAFLITHHPRLVLTASPIVFAAHERDSVLERVLDSLIETNESLVGHPYLSPSHLGRLVTDGSKARLLRDAEVNEPVRGANALALLAYAKRPEVLERSLRLIEDPTQNRLLRRAAISVVASVGHSALIPRLYKRLDQADALHLTIVDCICVLTDENFIPEVLRLLLTTDAMVSSAYVRFRDFESRKSLVAVLDFLLSNPNAINTRRLSAYIVPVLELLDNYWDQTLSDKVADLVVAWEADNTYGATIDCLPTITKCIRKNDTEGRVAIRILDSVLSRSGRLLFLREFVATIATTNTACWAVREGVSQELVDWLAYRGSAEVRAILKPHISASARQTAPSVLKAIREDDERKALWNRRIQEQKEALVSCSTLAQFLQAAGNLRKDSWPAIEVSRKEWLQQQVDDELGRLDLLENIRWIDQNSSSIPRFLPVLMELTDQYALRLAHDERLVHALKGWGSETIVAYHKRFGLSAAALAEFDRLLANSLYPKGALGNALGFLQNVEHKSESILRSLMTIVRSPLIVDYYRTNALEILEKFGVSDEELVSLAKDKDALVSGKALELLVKRQHRPTLERKLAAILSDDDSLKAGNISFVDPSPLSWIAGISRAEFWKPLVKIRRRAIELGLPYVINLVEVPLSKINMAALAEVVRTQRSFAPREWQEAQTLRAVELEQNARLDQARKIPFDQVIYLLTTFGTLALVKVWCEGPNDIPAFEAFLSKVARANNLKRKLVVQDLAGWANVRSPNRDYARLWDGCFDVIVVLDGDNGRDWTRSGNPYSEDAKAVEKRLRNLGIPLRVLERYAPENYFSQRACESVLGSSLAAYFPLPNNGPVLGYLPGFTKKDNGRIAEAMHLDELAGTDLGRILQEICHKGS